MGMWWGGWRSNRGFCGKLSYRIERTIWKYDNHLFFPLEFQDVIFECMLIWEFRPDAYLAIVPQEVLFHIFAYLNWRDFVLEQ
jgi:hypothetical protein